MENISSFEHKFQPNILALPDLEAYCLIFIYIIVILASAFGSLLIIGAVIRTRSNVYIGNNSKILFQKLKRTN